MVGYGETFVTGKIRIEYTQRQNQTLFRNELFISLVAFAIVTSLSVLYMIFRMRKFVITPIQGIVLGLRRVDQGLYDTSITVSTSDEMGEIATVFNQMTSRLKKLIGDLSNSRHKIEEQYHDLYQDQIRLGASIESLDIGFIMTNVDNEVILINRVAKDILSYELTADGVPKTTSTAHPWTTDIIQTKLAKVFDFKDNLNKLTKTADVIQVNELGY